MSDSQKNGQELKVERGGKDLRGRRRSMIRTPLEIEADDRFRRRFMHVVTPEGAVPSRAIQEIREGRHFPWRSGVRRAIEMHDAGIPREINEAALTAEVAWLMDALYETRLKPAA